MYMAVICVVVKLHIVHRKFLSSACGNVPFSFFQLICLALNGLLTVTVQTDTDFFRYRFHGFNDTKFP